METLNVIAALILWFDVFRFASCAAEFRFNPESIWHGQLQHIEFKDDPFLCADQNWNYQSARLVCQSLGFSDAMMYKTENNELASDTELAECTFSSVTDIRCGIVVGCSEVAWLACQLPGFEGCYSGATPSGYTQYRINDGQVTIEKCLAGCRVNRNKYAALSNGVSCYCSNELPRNSPKRAASNCDKPCAGDNGQACGGTVYSAVYNALLGSCEGNLTSDVGFITSPGFPGDLSADDDTCSWHFETSYFNRTLISIIGAEFNGGQQLGLDFDTTEIHRRTYSERDVSFDTGSPQDAAIGGGIWRTENPITREAEYNTVEKNITVRYSKQRSNAKWFILTFQVDVVDFDIMMSTTPSTTTNDASIRRSLSYLSTLGLVAVISWCTHYHN